MAIVVDSYLFLRYYAELFLNGMADGMPKMRQVE